MAFNSVEPFGDERADIRAGIVAAAIFNANKGKRGKVFTARDFMLFTEERIQQEGALLLSERIKLEFSKLPKIDKRTYGTDRPDTD